MPQYWRNSVHWSKFRLASSIGSPSAIAASRLGWNIVVFRVEILPDAGRRCELVRHKTTPFHVRFTSAVLGTPFQPSKGSVTTPKGYLPLFFSSFRTKTTSAVCRDTDLPLWLPRCRYLKVAMYSRVQPLNSSPLDVCKYLARRRKSVQTAQICVFSPRFSLRQITGALKQ